MPEIITCDCVPKPRVFSYGDSSPVEVADARTSIAYREYYQDSTVDILDLPYCTQIGAEAFRESSLQEIYIPLCQEIKANTFYLCQSFRGGDFSSVKTIRNLAFDFQLNASDGTNISLEFPSIETIDAEAFQNLRIEPRSGNIKLDIRNVKTIGQEAFWQAGVSLVPYPYYTGTQKILYLPKCEKIGNSAFGSYYSNYVHSYHQIILPAIKTVAYRAFYTCHFYYEDNDPASLVLGPNCTEIEEYICHNSINFPNLDIYVYATTPPRLLGEFYFRFSTETTKLPLHIYVPSSSVNAYKAATYWTNYSSVITAMPSDHQTIDTWLIN